MKLQVAEPPARGLDNIEASAHYQNPSDTNIFLDLAK
jgi:hypothetical protein